MPPNKGLCDLCHLLSQTDQSSPTPVFGSAATFGAGTGFGGFSADAGAFGSKPAEGAAAGAEGNEDHQEEECSATFKPVVELEEVETTTGEELETALIEL